MRKSLTTFLFLNTIILSSCGGGNSKATNKTFNAEALIADERELTPDERNIATRICYALQSKSKNFRTTDFLGTSFKFTIKNTDCQNGVATYPVSTILKYDAQNNLEFTPVASDSSLRFTKKVQTDSSGFLAQLCPKILSNEVITNTTATTLGKVQISFQKENLDGFTLTYFNLQTDLSYKIDSAEKFQFRTQADLTTGKILGMDEYYAAQKVCGSSFDKNKFSNFEQNFTSR